MKPVIWSYGGGIQTIAILMLIKDNRLPKPNLAIMADTGRERSSTWRYLEEYGAPLMEELGITFHVASHDLARVDLYAGNGDLLIPAYTTTGKLRTFCSNEWKKFVVRRALRQLGYGPGNPVIEWLGMSLDEIHRMRQSDVQWIETQYPLIFDVPLRRVECQTIIERAGLPLPSKSACWGCPHLRDAEWLDVKENDPDDFAKAVALDIELRDNDDRGGVWLHKSRQPLSEVEFVPDNQDMPLLECAASCWT